MFTGTLNPRSKEILMEENNSISKLKEQNKPLTDAGKHLDVTNKLVNSEK